MAITQSQDKATPMPGEGLNTTKMPGHWLLARLGKRVLRPGGLELTHRMLRTLNIRHSDDVVEFAPGMGITARLTLERNPASYTAIEQNEEAAGIVRCYLCEPQQKCCIGRAESTGLSDQSASVVYGEAMLTMQTPDGKRRIVHEAYRLLKPGGRYGIHEMCLVPDDADSSIRKDVEQALSSTIHVGARPLTCAEWRALLESEGFTVQTEVCNAMRLLEPDRMLKDEGLKRTLRIAWNLMRDSDARKRVATMRGVFRRYQSNIKAVMMVATKSKE